MSKISLYYDDFVETFDYMIPCCEYMINNGYSNASHPEGVRSQINKCIRNNKKYNKHFSFKKL